MRGTVAAGVTITARSTGATDVCQRCRPVDAEDAVALGVDRVDGAAERRGEQVLQHVRPTLPGASVAPMTATERGVKKDCSGWRPCLKTSFS